MVALRAASGGVDSGVLLAMISELTGRPLRTFSVSYGDGGSADEGPDAAAIARRFGAEHTPITLDGDAVFRRLPHTVWATDELLGDYACLPTSFLAERIALFSIVVGVALVLIGGGFLVLTIGVLRPETTSLHQSVPIQA